MFDGGDAITELMKSNSWLDDTGIYNIIFHDNTHVTMESIEIELNDYKNKTGGNSPPALINLTGVLSISSEGRQYIAEEITKLGVPATALVVKSRISRLIGSFFIGINKSDFPVRLFDDEHKAIEWLQGFLHV